jgi:hypothetical protein
MSGAIPPLPNTSSWRGAQLKYRDNLLYLTNLVTHLHLIPRLRMHGAILPLHQYVLMAWCLRNGFVFMAWDLFKQRDNFTLPWASPLEVKWRRPEATHSPASSAEVGVEVDNIEMDITEIRWEGVDWIHLAQDRDQWWAVVNTEMNVQVQQKAGHYLSS